MADEPSVDARGRDDQARERKGDRDDAIVCQREVVGGGCAVQACGCVFGR